MVSRERLEYYTIRRKSGGGYDAEVAVPVIAR